MAVQDPLGNFGGAADGPYIDGFAITPSDSQDFQFLTSAIWVGGTGNIVIVTQRGTVLTLSGVPAGTMLRIRAKRVNSTSTTATLLVGLF